nr:radical SAM family heme chaperone HemW [Atopobacter phocae]
MSQIIQSQNKRAVYIHIPFCEHICYYCDFNKVYLEGQPVDEYVDLLVREMELKTAQDRVNHQKETVQSIYIGGGTPSVLTLGQFERLFKGIYDCFNLQPDGEFTIEMNPNNVSQEVLALFKTYGVNRLSVGVQSFDDDLLKRIGRTHSKSVAIDAFHQIERAGFDNVSMDLIFRLPHQSIEQYQASLDTALSIDLPHYSVYSLILERKTVFYNLMRLGKLPLPSEDTEVEMFARTMQQMEANGRHHYEISNYGKPGYESQHNLAYWNRVDYYGFGAGAHGLINNVRYQNLGPIQHYLNPLRNHELPILEQNELTSRQQMEEFFFLGLRKMEGVNFQTFEQQFNQSVASIYQETIDHLKHIELIESTAQGIKLSPQGVYLGNDVFQAFLLED